MRIIFFGTPEFAVPPLKALLAGPDDVVGVVCQPDRPAGRGQRLTAPPVKRVAAAASIPILQPQKVRTSDFLEQLRQWQPDLIVVVAYGRILPKAVLELPPHGCINVHASLLPRYRGAAPMQWAILNGDAKTGVTIIQMSEEMDAGDILLTRETPLGSEEALPSLQSRLAALGAEALVEALEELRAGRLQPQPQDPRRVTFAPMIRKEDGAIDWSRPAAEIARRVRAFDPWPSAYTTLYGKRLKICRARVDKGDRGTAERPGTVVAVGDTIRVVCGEGDLLIEELQLEGRKRLSAGDLSRGSAIAVGAHLGER
jgi:methionyl-tRNA formyltransferase